MGGTYEVESINRVMVAVLRVPEDCVVGFVMAYLNLQTFSLMICADVSRCERGKRGSKQMA